MTKKRSAILAALLAGGAAWGQSAATVSFDVASIKRVATGETRAGRRVMVAPDRLDFPGVTLWYCISYAYGVKSYQMSGPDWLRKERYDVVAKGPAGARPEDLPKMMQSLLRERFALKTHQERRQIPVLLLTPGPEGPKLKNAAPESGDGLGGARVGMSASESGGERLEIRGGGMATLANTLTGLLGRSVVDKTGLEGRYDFSLEFSRYETADARATGGFNEPPRLPPPPAGAEPGVSIYSSIRQLGLKLAPEKLPMNVLVVDGANRAPVEN